MQELSLNQQEPYQSALVPDELPYDFQQQTASHFEPELPSMTPQTKVGLHLLSAAILAGISGDQLMRSTPWGLNVGIWVSVVTLLIFWHLRRHNSQLLGQEKWLAVPAIFFAATFAWRDSSTLNGLSLLALLLIATMIVMQARRGQLLLAGITDYLHHLVIGLFMVWIGPLLLVFGDISWKEVPRDGWSKHALAIGRGMALATPLLIIFGLLFAAADSVFGNILARTFNVDGLSVFTHILTISLFTWVTAGFLRYAFIKSEPMIKPDSTVRAFSLGIIETITVLGLLNVLFAAFVIVQFRYFFGGRTNIPNGRGFEYAEYARHGFFELVWVSVLVLPLLLGMHWLLRKDNPVHAQIFRLLAGVKLVLLAVIMLSAMQRMRLYQLECGLTELRVYTMAFMLWLGGVFIWFAATVLRGQRQRFAFGAVLTALAMIAGLHFMNPDDLIVRVNLQRAQEGKAFDAAYTSSLSADSIPALLQGTSVSLAADRNVILQRLQYATVQYQSTDWRAWNWSRQRAAHVFNKK